MLRQHEPQPMCRLKAQHVMLYVVLTMPTLNKAYLFIYLFIYLFMCVVSVDELWVCVNNMSCELH